MEKFLKALGVFTLVVLVNLTACKDDDDSCENGTFEMSINGNPFTAKDFDNTMAAGESLGFDGKRIDIRATDAQGRQLILTLFDMTSGSEGPCVTTSDVYIPMDDMTNGFQNIFFFTLTDDGVVDGFNEGTLRITSCDSKKKRISGEFTLANDDTAGSGSFTNMCYRILED